METQSLRNGFNVTYFNISKSGIWKWQGFNLGFGIIVFWNEKIPQQRQGNGKIKASWRYLRYLCKTYIYEIKCIVGFRIISIFYEDKWKGSATQCS